MKKYISFLICLLVCLLALAGCSCRHTWTDADCVTAKTCSSCQETEGEPLGHTWTEAGCVTAKTCSECNATEGEPLGHTPGQWQEDADIVAATVSRAQHCTICNELTGSETVPLTTLLGDGLFLFTPNEFLERLTAIANGHVEGFSCEFASDSQLIAFVNANGKQAILQFFGDDTATLAADKADAAEVWCVSLIAVGEADATLRRCFFMACDPLLDTDSAFNLDINVAVATLNAAENGQTLGYYQLNELLYESCYIPEGALGDTSMEMTNIYASDFR